MKLLPKSKLTFIAIIVIIYAYSVYPPQFFQEKEETPLPPQTERVLKVKPKNEKGLQPLANLYESINTTPTGKAFIKALTENAAEKQFGTNDINLLLALKANRISTKDIILGNGNKAACGSVVTYYYQLFTYSNKNITPASDVGIKITAKLGSTDQIGVHQGIVGMYAGGKRRIIVPASYIKEHPGQSNKEININHPLIYEVQLIEVQNPLPEFKFPISKSDQKLGSGPVAYCGKKVKAKINLKSSTGADLNKGNNIYEFTLGSGQIPVGIEEGILGMTIGGIRGVLIPPVFLKSDSNSLIQIPENNFAIAEIELLEVGDIEIEK